MIFLGGIMCNALDPCQYGRTLDYFSAQLLRDSWLNPNELSRLLPQRYQSSSSRMYLPHIIIHFSSTLSRLSLKPLELSRLIPERCSTP